MFTRRRAAVATAASALVLGLGVVAAPHASAEPYITGDRYEDCGSEICTVYWSRPKTAELYSEMQSPGWATARYVVIANEARSLSVGRGQATLDGIEDAAGAATTYGGCLQYAFRKDGQGRAQWSYTTHPDYCWDPADFQF